MALQYLLLQFGKITVWTKSLSGQKSLAGQNHCSGNLWLDKNQWLDVSY
jgi:hypothetical protein